MPENRAEPMSALGKGIHEAAFGRECEVGNVSFGELQLEKLGVG